MWRDTILILFIFLLSFSFTSFFSFDNVFAKTYDLTTFSGREIASIEKPVSTYETKKCEDLTHTDGKVITFCLAEFQGTTGGFYDWDKNLMVVGSLDIYVLVHEITHATTLHFYEQGFTDITSPQTQEKMAYNAENLLRQMMTLKDSWDLDR